MKKSELLPTKENLINTLCRDIINRNKDIEYFYNILQAQEESSTIALDGGWGSGKTFFVRQTQMIINALNQNIEIKENRNELLLNQEERKKVLDSISINSNEKYYFAIYFDAWANDNDTDPILSLIYEITNQLDVEFSLKDSDLAYLLNIVGEIAETIFGHNIGGIIKSFASKENLSSEDKLSQFRNQKRIEQKINEFLSSLLSERGNRLVIFVDELDRCKPTYAVKLLEQIKHYMLDDRVTFVFSTNLDQLQHTIKHYYGENFDSSRYLDRFFDLRLELPPVDMDKFYGEIGLNENYSLDIVIKQIITNYNFQLREISKFIPQVKVAVHKVFNNDSDFMFRDGLGKQLIMIFIVPLIIGLRIASTQKYKDFIDGMDSKPLIDLLSAPRLKYFLLNLLNDGESFENIEEKETVSKEFVIDRLYNGIFRKQYTYEDHSTVIGEYEFNKNSKSFAIKVANLMSDYAELS